MKTSLLFSEFISRKLRIYFGLSVATGLLIFAVEALFAAALSLFLGVLGLQAARPLNLPFLPTSVTGVLLLVSGAALFRGALVWLQELTRGLVSEEFRALQASRLVRWALRSPEAEGHRVLHIYNDQINGSAEFMMSIQQALVGGVTAGAIFISLMLISVPMTVSVLFLSALLLIPLKFANKKIRAVGKHLLHSSAQFNERLGSSIRNRLLLRIYGQTHVEGQHLVSLLDTYRSGTVGYNTLSGFIVSIPQVFGVVILCAVTAMIERFNWLPKAQIVLFFYLFYRFSQNSSGLIGNFTRITLRRESVRILFEWYQQVSQSSGDRADEGAPVRFDPSAPAHPGIGLEVEALAFAYPNQSEIITNLQFKINGGECLVITGRSGAGKSTLLALLMGVHQPVRGFIRFFSSSSLADQGLFHNLSYVGPEPFLVSGTLLDNLLYGAHVPLAENELADVLSIAGCDFISKLPGGLQYRITELGEGLSAGQKQRLSIARALSRRPRLLVLDEATSHLDPETELTLLQRFMSLKKEMSLIIVTHRPQLEVLGEHFLRL